MQWFGIPYLHTIGICMKSHKFRKRIIKISQTISYHFDCEPSQNADGRGERTSEKKTISRALITLHNSGWRWRQLINRLFNNVFSEIMSCFAFLSAIGFVVGVTTAAAAAHCSSQFITHIWREIAWNEHSKIILFTATMFWNELIVFDVCVWVCVCVKRAHDDQFAIWNLKCEMCVFWSMTTLIECEMGFVESKYN